LSAFARVIARNPRAWLAGLFAITLLAIAGIGRLTFDSSLRSLTVADDPERKFHEEVEATFGQEEIGVLAVVLDAPYDAAALTALDKLTDSIGAIDGVARALSLSTAADAAADVVTPPRLLPRGPITDATVAHVRERVAANPSYVPHLVAKDDRAVAVNVFFDRDLDENAAARVDAEISRLVEAYDGPGSLYFTGAIHIQARAVQLMRTDLVRFLPLSLACMMVVLWLAFRSFRAIVLPLASITLGVGELLGVMGWLGEPITLATLVLLLLVIGGSYAVHVTAAVLEGEAEREGNRLLEGVMHRVGLPVLVSAITTSIGFGSLAFHPIPAIATLGVYAAIGVALTTLGCLVGLPLAFMALPARERKVTDAAPVAQPALDAFSGLDRILLRVVDFAVRRRRLVYAIAAAIAVVSFVGALRVRVDTDILSAFRDSSDVRVAHEAIAKHLAGASPVSVVVKGTEPGYFKSVIALRRVKDLQDFIDEIDGVDATLSIVNYLDALDLGLQSAGGDLTVDEHGEVVEKPAPPSFWDAPAAQLPEILKLIELSKETFSGVVEPTFQRIRVTVRTSLTSSRDVEQLADEIETYASNMFPAGVEARATGNLVVVSALSERVLIGQVQSVAFAFGVIFLLVTIMFLSARVGFAAMIPNVLPVIVFFGVMGWARVELNLATSIIASLALGIAVDDTIHFMARLNRLVKTARSQHEALLETMRAVGRAVVATTLTLTAGFFVMVLSEFVIISQFGWLSAFTLLVALVTNIALLPALLATVSVISVWDLVAFRLGPSPHLTIPLFHGLGRFAVRLVVLLGTLKNFERGQPIVRKGEPGHEMYLVVNGRADVLGNDGETVLATLARGDVFGEMALLRSATRVADVVARETVETLVIDEAFLKRLRVRYPRIASRFFINIARILSDRLERANRRREQAS
jgi:predicted RND superfamily exporter protein